MFWVLSVYFNIRNTFPKSGTFLLGHPVCIYKGTRWRSQLIQCTTSRKVAHSITDGVIGIFQWQNTSGRNVALESNQSLTEMSTRNIPWGVKAVGALGWQHYHVHVPTVLKSGRLNFLEPWQPAQGLFYLCFVYIYIYIYIYIYTHTYIYNEKLHNRLGWLNIFLTMNHELTIH